MFIDPPPKTTNLEDLLQWCEKLQQRILLDDLFGSVTWDPGSIADGDEVAKNVVVTGAVLGDYAICSFSVPTVTLTLTATVTAIDNVKCVLANNTGGPIDLAEGTLYARVFKRVQ
jgi:hypothetical protein